MAFTCLTAEAAKRFRKALKGKDITLEELIKASPEARVKALEPYAGDQAGLVSDLIESKLILKNKILGLKNALSKVGQIGRYSAEKQVQIAEALSEFRAKQQERILNPSEEQTFLQSLAKKVLGTEVTREEAKIAFDMETKAYEFFKEADTVAEKWSSPEAEAKYGAQKVILKKYLDNLDSGQLPVKGMLKEYSQEIKTLWKEDKQGAIMKVAGDAVYTLSKNMINAVASWDNSFIGRQGAITLIKSPTTWWKMAKASMTDIYQTFKGSSPEDVLMAKVYSDFDYINGNYKKAGISFGIEEEVPSALLEKIPAAGRIFKAADVAFTDSAIRARMGLFKIQKKLYEATGNKLDDVTLKDIGNVVNAITARGKVGDIGSSKLVQLLMWAPRMLKADWDVLTAHTFGFGLKTSFAKLQAAKTVFGVVVVTAAISAIAKGMGAEVETDPRSSDYLSIKIGDTRIKTPFGRGMPQIVTLIARLVTQSSKSTSTGLIRNLNTGEFGSQTLFDVGMDFLTNKTTPPAGAVIAWLKGSDFKGDKPTIGGTAFGFLPISVQNFIQLKDQNTTQAVVGAFIDLFGISSNTYSSTGTDWTQSTGVELKAFQAKVGDAKFKEANDLYNKQVSNWLASMKTNAVYQKLSSDDKQKVITNKKSEIKSAIFKKYGFVYKTVKATPLPKL